MIFLSAYKFLRNLIYKFSKVLNESYSQKTKTKMQVFFSYSNDNQKIGRELLGRLKKLPVIREAVVEEDFDNGDDAYKRCDCYLWLVSNKNLTPATWPIFNQYSEQIGRKNVSFFIHLEDCKDFNFQDDLDFQHIPQKNNQVVCLESAEWDGIGNALDTTISQISDALQVLFLQKEGKRSLAFDTALQEYLNHFGILEPALKEYLEYKGYVFQEAGHPIVFTPIHFRERKALSALLKQDVVFFQKHKARFFFFPLDPFESEGDSLISEEEFENACSHLIAWVQKNNLGEKIHVVNTYLLRPKPLVSDEPKESESEKMPVTTQVPPSIHQKPTHLTPGEFEELKDLITKGDFEEAFDIMDDFDWGNNEGAYNDFKVEWINSTGINKQDFRQRLIVLLKFVFL